MRHELRKAVGLQKRARESWQKSRDLAMHAELRTHHQESAALSYGWARYWLDGEVPEYRGDVSDA